MPSSVLRVWKKEVGLWKIAAHFSNSHYHEPIKRCSLHIAVRMAGLLASLASHLLTVPWLRPNFRAIALADRPRRRIRTYWLTSPAVTRRYEGVLRSRDVGLRGTPRSFRGFRPSMAVSALSNSLWFICWVVPLVGPLT